MIVLLLCCQLTSSGMFDTWREIQRAGKAVRAEAQGVNDAERAKALANPDYIPLTERRRLAEIEKREGPEAAELARQRSQDAWKAGRQAVQIMVDGHREGFLTPVDGSTILLHNGVRHFSNAELLEIRKAVALKLHPLRIVGIKQLPPPPPRPVTAFQGDL